MPFQCITKQETRTSDWRRAIRGFLKGKARSLLLSVSEHATAENIIDKLDGVHGNVYSSEALLEKFFKETQQTNRSVAE
jgi:arginine/ornithine N-succinyltransferase beta subunit